MGKATMVRWCYGVVGLMLFTAPVQSHDVSDKQIICGYFAEASDSMREAVDSGEADLRPYHQIHLGVLLIYREKLCGEDHAEELEEIADAVDRKLDVTVK